MNEDVMVDRLRFGMYLEMAESSPSRSAYLRDIRSAFGEDAAAEALVIFDEYYCNKERNLPYDYPFYRARLRERTEKRLAFEIDPVIVPLLKPKGLAALRPVLVRWAPILMTVAVIAGLIYLYLGMYAPSGLTGVVQRSRMVQGGFELALAPSQGADYVLVETEVLLDPQGVIAIRRDRLNILRLGDQYVGRRIRASGTVQLDSAGRRFVLVSRREQIELQ